MHTIRRIDLADREIIAQRVRLFAGELTRRLPVHEVYLFGSFATGEIHDGSDIDLLVIGDFQDRLFERIGRVLDLTDLPIEPLVYTPDEICAMKQAGNPFITEVLRTAIRLA